VLHVIRLHIVNVYLQCVCVYVSLFFFHSPLCSQPPPPWHSANNFLIIVKSVWGMDVHSGYSKGVAVCVLMQQEDLLAGL
jgi:hypothetical protein